MKRSFKILLIIVLLVIIPVTALAENEDSAEIITGTYQFSAIEGSNKQLQNTFLYKDSDFTKSSFIGSKSLETLSIQVAGASLSWYGSEIDKYEIDFSQNDYNIRDFLNKIKFNNIESNKYYNSEKEENSVGVIIGSKTIIQDGKEYTLLAIIPRSAGYKQEWAGNFTIGENDLHEGFKSARDEILRFTKQYIEKNNIEGSLKVWTAGYSRGAAISNMIGGFFAGGGIDYFEGKVSITPEDVYCYTIGTPNIVKNGASKNDELSVSANRLDPNYANDTKADAFFYTKGGTVSVNDTIYNGIRNIISYEDSFSLLPPEKWGFTKYGKVIDSREGLYSEEEMLNELKSISEYVYNEFTSDGKIKKFNKKAFDLKSLSIINKENDISQVDFFKERIDGMMSKIDTSKKYKEEVEDGLKSAIGTYGMLATLISDIGENNDILNDDLIYPLVYSYLSYASFELQGEERAFSEEEAITLVIEDLLTYFTGAEINNETFTIDDFVKIVLKYLIDNENEEVSNSVISGIVSIAGEEYKNILDMFKIFSKDENATVEDGLKAFIRACYYGSDEESMAYPTYQEPEQARQLLYMIALMAQKIDISNLQPLMQSENGKIDGHGRFEDLVKVILENIKNVKNEDGDIVKTYSSIGELADEKLKELLDNLLKNVIIKSEELYGEEYKNDLEKHINNLKQNITKVREKLCELFLYTKGGFDVGKSLENAITFVENAPLFAMPHFDEIYLALSRTSNRYDDEYVCIKNNGKVIDYNAEDLSLVFSFDYYLFKEKGKLYIDNEEIPYDKYDISKGSTIITLKKDLLNTLNEGRHTVVAKIDDKEANAYFEIEKIEEYENNIDNPPTVDNIMFYLSTLGLSTLGLACFGIYIKKSKVFN